MAQNPYAPNPLPQAPAWPPGFPLLGLGGPLPSDAPGSNPLGFAPDLPSLADLDRRQIEAQSAAQPDGNNVISVGGQQYLGIDNGRANVLTPYTFATALNGVDPLQRQRDLNRLDALVNSPLGAGAYGAATLAGASPDARDRALAWGYAMDTALQGRLDTAIGPEISPAGPEGPVSESPLRWQNHYGTKDELDRATGVTAIVTPENRQGAKRTAPSLEPVGFDRARNQELKQQRGHLLARGLGGIHNDTRNFAMLDNSTNGKSMQVFESELIRRVKGGEVMNYWVKPLYQGGNLLPNRIMLTAIGSRGFQGGIILDNPAARRQ